MKNRIALTSMALTAGAMMLLFTFGVSAQSIETGDATSGTVIENVVNTNIVKCCTPTPTQKPEEPTPTPTEEQPTPTPTTPPTGGGGPSDGGRGGEGGGGAAAAPAVLGLAVTSGENELFNLLKLLPAFSSLAVGYGLLRRAPDGARLRKNA